MVDLSDPQAQAFVVDIVSTIAVFAVAAVIFGFIIKVIADRPSVRRPKRTLNLRRDWIVKGGRW